MRVSGDSCRDAWVECRAGYSALPPHGMQLFVGEPRRSFLGERLDAFLPTKTLQAFKKHAQAVRPSGRQDEVAAHDLLPMLALRVVLFADLGPQLLHESAVDLGSFHPRVRSDRAS